MFWIESIVRRVLLSFSVAVFTTTPFIKNIQYLYELPFITLGVAILLFLFSWIIEKELKQIFMNEQKKDDETLWGQFERKFPKLSKILWAFFLTFAAIHISYIALDQISVIEVNGHRVKFLSLAIIIAALFRLLSRDTYRKI